MESINKQFEIYLPPTIITFQQQKPIVDIELWNLLDQYGDFFENYTNEKGSELFILQHDIDTHDILNSEIIVKYTEQTEQRNKEGYGILA